MTQVILNYAHTLGFSCFTFSFNQIQLLIHETDSYRHKEHPRNGIIGKYLIYSGKLVFKILVVVVVVVVQKPGKIWR